METEIPEGLQPCMEALAWRSTSSTDVSPADVAEGATQKKSWRSGGQNPDS